MPRYFASVAPPPPSSYLTLTAAPDGGWVPVTYPRATQASGITFWGAVQGTTGNIEVMSVNNSTLVVTGPVTLHPALGGLYGPPDDHAAPAIHVRTSDSKLLVCYCVQGDSFMRKVISASALDITNWSSESHLSLGGSNYLYPTIAQLSGEASGRIYLHWKDFPGTTYIRQSISNDGGATFSASNRIYGSSNVFYAFATDNATRMDFIVTDSAPGSGGNGLYHFYEIAGQLYKTDGTAISAGIPIAASDATVVYSSGGNAFPYSITYDGSGHPVVAVGIFGATATYVDMRWNGSAWVQHTIDTTTAAFGTQPPGITHCDNDANRVIYGKKVGTDFHMFEATSADSGVTWTSTAIATGYTTTNIPQTPTLVTKSASQIRVLWTHGVWTTDYNYSVGTDGTP